MMKPQSPNSRVPIREMLRRIDRVAGDLNVLLVVIAIGLATLDMTFLVAQTVADHLPPIPITRVSYDTPQSPAK